MITAPAISLPRACSATALHDLAQDLGGDLLGAEQRGRRSARGPGRARRARPGRAALGLRGRPRPGAADQALDREHGAVGQLEHHGPRLAADQLPRRRLGSSPPTGSAARRRGRAGPPGPSASSPRPGCWWCRGRCRGRCPVAARRPRCSVRGSTHVRPSRSVSALRW